MARHYDRLIRYYDSWFDDLLDQDKELTPGECWRVILAIRDAQQMSSTEPLRNLPLEIRRALSMSTLIEQVERIIERCDNMRQRGAIGGRAANAVRNPGPPVARVITDEITDDMFSPDILPCPDNDGVQRNYAGLVSQLKTWGLSNLAINSTLKVSNFGQIGHPIWKMVASSRYKESPGNYLLACLNTWNPSKPG